MKDDSPPARTAARSDPLAATPEKMLPFVHALAGDVERQVMATLKPPATLPAALAGAAAAHRCYEDTWRYVQSLQMVPHACRAGCSFCCYLTVEATAPEVFGIAAHLQATRTPAQLEALKERLRQTAARVAGLTPAGRVQAQTPCALLDGGLCTAHAVRPLACRSWNSRDAGACERVWKGEGGDLRPAQDQRPEGINAGVHAGFVAALQSAGLPEEAAHGCELNTALSLALSDPDAAPRWLAGEDTLAPARAVVRYAGEAN